MESFDTFFSLVCLSRCKAVTLQLEVPNFTIKEYGLFLACASISDIPVSNFNYCPIDEESSANSSQEPSSQEAPLLQVSHNHCNIQTPDLLFLGCVIFIVTCVMFQILSLRVFTDDLNDYSLY